MKKKYVVILLVIVLIGILTFVFAKVMIEQRKNDELEAVQIFEKRAAVGVEVKYSYEDIEEIQKNIENIEYVKNVTLKSNEDKAEEFKNNFDTGELFEGIEMNNIFPDSFIVQFDIDSVDNFENLKTVDDEIMSIDGIDKVEADGCKEIIEVYEETGIKGLREYEKIYTIMDEQGVNGVTTYLDEHPQTRELLKDFIHF